MKYELLNPEDTLRQGDEWYDDDPSLLEFVWRPINESEIGSNATILLYRRPIQSWQPIDTAPKDGTPILVGWWVPHHDGGGRTWCSAVAQWGRPYNPVDEEDWCLTETGEHAISSYLSGTPTHWMPLPTEPEKPEQI